MATSPNFSWPEPDNSDLVKNGALAIRTAVNAIDSSMADLKGGTTGQVLAKATNTDMDFTWVAQDDSNAIQNAIVDAKGDLIAASANDTPARLAVGANDLLLTAASGETTGLKYTGAWTTWSPTLTNITVGNGAVVARYQQIGKIVNFYFKFTLGSTSAISGSYPRFTLPFTPQQNFQTAIGVAVDFGVGGYPLTAGMFSSNEMFPSTGNTGGAYFQESVTTATVPFTWGNNDWFWLQGSFEVA